MSPTFVCKACGRERERNYRLGNKEQLYCRERDCQRQRRREYQRTRRHREPAYEQMQKNCRSQWRQRVSLAEYQRAYRESHPDYTTTNRQQQRQRNAKRRRQTVSTPLPAPTRDPVIVKMNSCNSVKRGTYSVVLTPGETLELIVKMNSCCCDFSKRSANARAPVASSRVIVSDSIAPA